MIYHLHFLYNNSLFKSWIISLIFSMDYLKSRICKRYRTSRSNKIIFYSDHILDRINLLVIYASTLINSSSSILAFYFTRFNQESFTIIRLSIT